MNPQVGPVELLIIGLVCGGLVVLLAAAGAAVFFMRKNKKPDQKQ